MEAMTGAVIVSAARTATRFCTAPLMATSCWARATLNEGRIVGDAERADAEPDDGEHERAHDDAHAGAHAGGGGGGGGCCCCGDTS
eukprot:3545577-Pleurochrysis_carterae.AAC.1